MKKSDLKTGMIVTLCNGKQLMVYKNIQTKWNVGDVIVDIYGSDNWNLLDNYNEDLTNEGYPDLDIVKVEEVTHPYAFVRLDYDSDKRTVLWKRKEKKKYTYAQLKEILGEEFEIVKE